MDQPHLEITALCDILLRASFRNHLTYLLTYLLQALLNLLLKLQRYISFIVLKCIVSRADVQTSVPSLQNRSSHTSDLADTDQNVGLTALQSPSLNSRHSLATDEFNLCEQIDNTNVTCSSTFKVSENVTSRSHEENGKREIHIPDADLRWRLCVAASRLRPCNRMQP